LQLRSYPSQNGNLWVLPVSCGVIFRGEFRWEFRSLGGNYKFRYRSARHRTGEKCGRMLSIPACPPHTAELLLRNVLLCLRCTVIIVVVPAGTRRRQARNARPGGRGPCDGRSAHRAIVAMCDTADSFTWCVLERLLRALGHLHLVAQRTLSPSAVHVSSAVCGKPSSSAEPWRVN
jgi:hypothetical protein